MKQKLLDEAVKKLQEIAKDDDTECAHSDADQVLCDLLESLGYSDVVKAWDEVHKWYA
jgi:hypothetical protein